MAVICHNDLTKAIRRLSIMAQRIIVTWLLSPSQSHVPFEFVLISSIVHKLHHGILSDLCLIKP